MLMDKDKSCLVLIDVQEKLSNAVFNNKHMLDRCAWLLRLATEMDVPILACEQYPQGLGPTVESLANVLDHVSIHKKVTFSAYKDTKFKIELEKTNRRQIILMGIETHICVLQTALDLQQAGYQVFVVIDAISARHLADHHAGLDRMKHQGVQIVSSEMVFYEWVKQAGTTVFKALNQAFMKKENS
jgi:nicotinamidase-related amidase